MTDFRQKRDKKIAKKSRIFKSVCKPPKMNPIIYIVKSCIPKFSLEPLEPCPCFKAVWSKKKSEFAPVLKQSGR